MTSTKQDWEADSSNESFYQELRRDVPRPSQKLDRAAVVKRVRIFSSKHVFLMS